VRPLRKGDFANETVFGDNPVAMAERWVREGACYLHVVDLDGAREGAPRNFAVIREIAERVPVPVETGGGIRSVEALDLIVESKVAKAVLGTSAVEDEAFLSRRSLCSAVSGWWWRWMPKTALSRPKVGRRRARSERLILPGG
jgi:phosphoribosylformimino-5-aminoimidazole carboxamide ribonucleotide (ProFAR) isomerase